MLKMSSSEFSNEERLVRIETVLAHLQHDIETLNASLTEHFRRLRSFEERFNRIEHELESMSDGSEDRDSELERPPHY